MDTLPKNNTDDLSSFAGSYPSSVPVPNNPPIPPPVSPPIPPAPEMTGVSNPLPAANVTVSAPPPVPTTGADGVVADNPFTTNTPTPPKPKGPGLKRILLMLILLVVLLGIGFFAFRLVGNFLASRQTKVLQYWGLWENEQMVKGIIDEYQSLHPDVQVVYTRQNPKQYRERLQAQISQETGPDLFRFHSTWVPMLKDSLAPSGKTGYTSDEFRSTFYPVATDDLVVSGAVYGVPLMFDGLGLYYNEDLLRSAGVTPPTTWVKFTEAAKILTVKDETGKIVTAGAALGVTSNIEHYSDILAVMMLQNGANLANPTSDEAQQALTFYRQFAQAPNNVWDETLDNSILAFASGQVGFIFAPSWQAFTIMENNPQLKFQIIPIPQLEGTTINWASYWAEGVSKNSPHKDEAWEFLKFLSSKETMIKSYTEQAKIRPFGEPYARVDLAQTLIDAPYVGAYIRQAPTAQSFYVSSRTFDNGINDRMIKYVEDAINSQGLGVSAQAALSTMGQGFAQVLSSYGLPVTAPALIDQ